MEARSTRAHSAGSSSNSSTKPKRARASKPKVKSGCITCKIRRVKCGEEKPGCLRCQKFGRECDGYASEQDRRRKGAPVAIQPRVMLTPTLSNGTPSYSLPNDDKDYRYYQLFCERSAYDFGSSVPIEFWKRVVLHESHSEPSIRHAIVALAVLAKSIRHGSLQHYGVIVPVIVGLDQYMFALDQYSNAIVELRRMLSQSEPRTRTALVASLLFVCFENFNGNCEVAKQHMQCGLDLLEQFQSLNLQSLTEIIPMQQHDDLQDSDELFELFARLDAEQFAHHSTNSSLFDDGRLLLFNAIEEASMHVPPVFTSTDEARKVWDFIREKCVAFHRKAGIFRYPAASGFSAFPPSPPQSSASSFISQSVSLPEELQQEYQTCLTLTAQWEAALWPLLIASQSPIPSPDGLPVWGSTETVLYLCNKISKIYLNVSETIGEEAFDMFNSDFEEIVLRSGPLIEEAHITGEMPAGPMPSGPFSFELGVIPPLHLTALKCRNAKIRRQAIALLLRCPRRSGSWNGFMLGKVDAWVMGLEEEGVDEWGLIPEDKRWRLADIKCNSHEKWAWARCYRSEWDGFGSVVDYMAECRETKMTWSDV